MLLCARYTLGATPCSHSVKVADLLAADVMEVGTLRTSPAPTMHTALALLLPAMAVRRAPVGPLRRRTTKHNPLTIPPLLERGVQSYS